MAVRFRDRIKALKRVKPSDLILAPKNYRGHSDRQRKSLLSSLDAVGVSAAALVFENEEGQLELIDGELRDDVFQNEGEGQKIPVLVLDVDRREAEMLLASIDPISAMADQDDAGMAELLRGLDLDGGLPDYLADIARASGVDIFSTDEEIGGRIGGGVGDDPGPMVDRAEELQAKWHVEPGDLWQVTGRQEHRIICGDARNEDTWQRLYGDDRADLVLSDPPYNVAYTGKTAESLTIENDAMSDADFKTLLVDALSRAHEWSIKTSSVYIFYASREAINFRQALEESGWQVKQELIWVKNAFVMGRQDYQWRHEPILYGWKQKNTHRWYGGRSQSTTFDLVSLLELQTQEDGSVTFILREGDQEFTFRAEGIELIGNGDASDTTIIRHARPNAPIDHPTMKPPRLIRRFILNSTQAGEIVSDPFLGSGSTIVAAEESGRRCFGSELDPRYVAATLGRLDAMGMKISKVKKQIKRRRKR